MPFTTDALSKCRNTVSAAFGLRPSPPTSERSTLAGPANVRSRISGFRLEVFRLEVGVTRCHGRSGAALLPHSAGRWRFA